MTIRLHWRIWHWLLDWVKLVETAIVIVTFTFYSPCWWGRMFNWYIDHHDQHTLAGRWPMEFRL